MWCLYLRRTNRQFNWWSLWVKEKITFWDTSDLWRCLSSWDLILKNSECETLTSWQVWATNDILEIGLIWWIINHSPLKFGFPNIVYAQVKMKSQIMKMYLFRNEMTSNTMEAIPLNTESPFQNFPHVTWNLFLLNHLPSQSPTLLPTWLSIYCLTRISHTFEC